MSFLRVLLYIIINIYLFANLNSDLVFLLILFIFPLISLLILVFPDILKEKKILKNDCYYYFPISLFFGFISYIKCLFLSM